MNLKRFTVSLLRILVYEVNDLWYGLGNINEVLFIRKHVEKKLQKFMEDLNYHQPNNHQAYIYFQ